MVKFNKIPLGIIILVYVLSVGVCPLDFDHANGHTEKNIPDIHCGLQLNSYYSSEAGGVDLFDKASYRKLFPLIVEPKPPILVYSILKIPKSA